VLFYLAAIEFYEDNFSLSAQMFDELLKKDPEYIDAYYYRGKCDMNTEDYKSAITYFTKGIAVDSTFSDFDMYFSRAFAFYYTDKPFNAIRDFTSFLKLSTPENPDRVNAFTYRSFSYNEAKDYQKALKDASDATAIDPSNNEAWLAKGVSYFNLNNLTEACKAFKKAKELGNEQTNEYLQKCK
jgi:tetratricopeptide (TPR) repeat protein